MIKFCYFHISRREYSGKITLEYSRRNNMEITTYDQILLFSYCCDENILEK